ncbi:MULTISPECIES: adenylate kinase [Micrococcaceae]|uniref:adenylate kinase n=1 Tax=Micrococcaceae TaxID=1268 RepID=UPI001A98A4DC|nr:MULTISPECIES: adenylate kinase [Micrococcaceae]QSZ51479.1 adenylate kinase [Arthrobacter sp. D5-1]QSZ55607.1 adenylate kinase [Paenarthrobacter ureafaciens]
MIIVGPPGSGKGTQAERISQQLGIPAISTGDIFRQNIAQLTPLGVNCKNYIDKGDLVPDDLTNQMVRQRLRQPDALDGFLLDGYPRTTTQVAELDDMLSFNNLTLDAALLLTVDDADLVTRLLERAKTTRRSDDTETVIRHRLDLYHQQTEQLIDLYRARGVLLTVDGNVAIDEVTEQITAQISSVDTSSQLVTQVAGQS